MDAYHDGERRGVHAGAEEDAEDADDHGPAGVGVGEVEHERCDGGDEGDLRGEYDEDPAACSADGVGEEERDVGELDDHAGAVDGDDEHAVRVHRREAVEHPHHAVEERGQVRHRRVLLHRLLLPDAVERRPAKFHRREVSSCLRESTNLRFSLGRLGKVLALIYSLEPN